MATWLHKESRLRFVLLKPYVFREGAQGNSMGKRSGEASASPTSSWWKGTTRQRG